MEDPDFFKYSILALGDPKGKIKRTIKAKDGIGRIQIGKVRGKSPKPKKKKLTTFVKMPKQKSKFMLPSLEANQTHNIEKSYQKQKAEELKKKLDHQLQQIKN